MKRTFLYLFSIFTLGVSLSSCLDDTGANTTGSNYAIIKRAENATSTSTTTYAWIIGGLPITWQDISSEYSVGDVIFMTYNIDLNSNSYPIITDKSNIQVTASYPTQYQTRIKIGEGVADTSAVANEHKFEALNLNLQYPQEDFDDRWIFTARVKLKDGQTIEPQFFYDTKEGMQHTSTNGELAKDVIVVDVKLNIKGDGDGAEKTQDKIFVVDFSQLRDELFRDITETEERNIWLRYYDNSKSQDRPIYVQGVGKLAYTPSSSN